MASRKPSKPEKPENFPKTQNKKNLERGEKDG